ncbi:MAG: hypothetical protein GWP08_07110 [Nitrospiraceae bacterium]|nr:hypothetical protein [Nitrospiraceae bacterium]
MTRQEFLGAGATAQEDNRRSVRVGFVGIGNRGTYLLRTLPAHRANRCENRDKSGII